MNKSDSHCMISKSIFILSLIAAFSASGLPLGVLQIGAWANMFEQFYEETNSVLLSAERVFDGQNRCLGCEFVTNQGTKSKEAFSSNMLSSEKINLDQGKVSSFSFFNPLISDQTTVVSQPPLPVFEKKETPPPRLFV
tara:strand:- start:4687 stop:5100 length:414 start_codon:yes stop_codon:yes gene_type:complete